MAEERTDQGERTHEPTAMRLAEARKRGNVPRSGDLTAAAAAMAALIVLGLGARGMLDSLTSMTATMLDGRSSAAAWVNPAAENVGASATAAARPVIAYAGGLMAAMAALVALAAFAQVGPVWASERVAADWSRVSWSGGWQRMMSSRTLVRVLFAVLKIAAVCGSAWLVARPMLEAIAATPRLDAWSLAGQAGQMTLKVMFYAGVSLLALGMAEYLYQRRQHRSDLMMTRREWIDDMKRAEGSPAVKQKQKTVRLGNAKAARKS